MSNWEFIKNSIYFEDGSLRDIYVFETDREDWRVWSNLVNEKYNVEFYNGRTQRQEDKIDIEEVFSFWANSSNFPDSNHASINLRSVIIKCYFFTDSEIENDIDPREVKTAEDHLAIMEYLHTVAGVLKKKVIVTTEMTKDDVLLEVNCGIGWQSS